MDHEGWQGGRLSVAGFVVHDSEFHADLSGLTISSQEEGRRIFSRSWVRDQ